jgi:hypothetical protein
MDLFGHSFNAAELVVIGLGGQWAFAALAHSLPTPDCHSSKAYLFVSNFLQFVAANLTLIRQGTPPPKCDDEKLVILPGPTPPKPPTAA